ncbi:MAG: polyhydroxybutyrate depolymerase [Pseudonocardiales bacterium]|jgi:polyhydroxybutyrate depolymerase|nr:polyhydroxybutyrate depolymerase [Pseudonocardiales bacterium]
MAGYTAQFMEGETGLSDMGDRSGFSVAYGQGVDKFWNAGGCCGGDTSDDLGYLRALIATASHLTPVDRHRIYLIGASNGGMMAYRAICEMPGVFAAAGIVSGALLRGVHCDNTRVTVYEIHGTADTTVPLDGGIGFQGVNFPAQSTDLSRVGKGSFIHLQKYRGGHSYPPWATSILVKWLAGYSTAA